jgi:prepilin-type N-terminal cleavage/methylation domain-containing protein
MTAASQRGTEGFTLVELAVALTIIALLLGMLIVPLGTQMDQQRAAETQRQMDQIREALIGFATATGRLPCPATATTASSTTGAGLETATCTGAAVEGVVPWATLGVPETDAWGRRFTYRVTAGFADAPGSASSTFALTDSGDMTVTNGSTNIATSVPAVIISHGKNGAGGYTSDGARMTLGTGDEALNTDANVTFVSRTQTDTFDDLVSWVSPNVLKSRMVAAGRLP